MSASFAEKIGADGYGADAAEQMTHVEYHTPVGMVSVRDGTTKEMKDMPRMRERRFHLLSDC